MSRDPTSHDRASRDTVETERLELRPPVESDRSRFVELFMDPDFMVFTGSSLDTNKANARFDRMLATAAEIPFAKQPIVERSGDRIVGYIGVAPWRFDGDEQDSWEFGYRLCTDARGLGYATEAGLALLAHATQSFAGTLYAMIDPTNEPSMRVIEKLGFSFWKQATIDGRVDNLYRLDIYPSGTALTRTEERHDHTPTSGLWRTTPRLASERLGLEPLRVFHATEMTSVLADEGLYAFTGGTPPNLDVLTRRYTMMFAGSRERTEHWHNWIVRHRDSGAAIGHLQTTVRAVACELAWTIGTQWQGNGFAKEAARTVRDWLASEGAAGFSAWIHYDHEASQAIAAWLGLEQTGTFDGEGEELWGAVPSP